MRLSVVSNGDAFAALPGVTTMDNARSYASPSTCQRAMRINSQNPCVVVASAILRRPRLIPSASSTLSRPMRSRQGDPVRRCVKASVNLVASSTSSRMSVIQQTTVRELANKMMLQTAADALAAEQAPDTLH